MRRLSFILILLVGAIGSRAQSPHGDKLKMDCAACHISTGWEVELDEVKFDHTEETGWELEGVHALTDCKLCHTSLVFDEAPSDCMSCHTDVHSQSVGNDCMRCHNSESWLVYDIPELHEANGFPLIGTHGNLACVECHLAEDNLRFDRIGNECIDCHRGDYDATQNPNHLAAGYSTECLDCHSPLGFGWVTGTVAHDFFPLEKGHDIQDCAQCHDISNFADVSAECVDCHNDDYQAATNPNHLTLGFSNDCASCHNLEPGWRPARYEEHDAEFFPIYSGEHQGEWDACIDCHINPNDFSEFSCTVCHTNPGTDDEHDGVAGYVYSSSACLACHPDGSEDGAFDHDRTGFPLREAHAGLDCLECHANGFENTPSDCFACHEDDYRASASPDHELLGLSTDCASCHTASPDWTPARFDIHDDFYELKGAHALIANECLRCHNETYTNTPNTCIGCHQDDYERPVDPNHVLVNFSTDCLECHTEDAWSPSTLDHDGLYFPIFSGEHQGEWNACTDCHLNQANYAEFTCTTCHGKNDTDDEHNGVQGYVYESNACLECHPNP